MFHILFEKANNFYEKIFEKYGRFLSKHYLVTISAAFIINLVLSVFIYRIKMLTDSDELFMVLNSQARADEKLVKSVYNSSYYLENNFFMHQLTDMGTWGELIFQTCQNNKDGIKDNILQEKYMSEMAKFNEFVLNSTYFLINATEKIDYYKVCAKRGAYCLIDGVDLLSKEFYVNWIQDAMEKKTRLLKEQAEASAAFESGDEEEEEELTESKAGGLPRNEFSLYIKIGPNYTGLTELSYNLGKHFQINSFNQSQNGSVPGYARTLKLRYNLKSNLENADPLIKKWELEFLRVVRDYLKTSANENIRAECSPDTKLRLSYATSQSIDLEIEANIQLDTNLIMGTFTLISIFTVILMSINTNWVTSPGLLLPSIGITSAMFGITSAFGFLSLIGYGGCNLIFVVPFLVVGIGIDDMFIIYASYSYLMRKCARNSANKENPYESVDLAKLIGHSLAHSGVSITITSLTDFVAFLVGLTTGFRSVQIFCMYAGFSILFCYFYQLTLFGGFLCLHTIRIKKQHNSVIFCVKQSRFKCSFCAVDVDQADSEQNNKAESVELAKLSNGNGVDHQYGIASKLDENNRAKPKPFCTRLNKKMRKSLSRLFKFLICTKTGKAISMILFTIYLSLSFWGAYNIKEGINLGDLVSEESYYNKYITDMTSTTDILPIIMFVIHKPIDYDSSNVRISIKNLISNARKIDGISDTFSINWMDSFSNHKIKYKKNIDNLYDSIKNFPPLINDLIVNKIEKNSATNQTKISQFAYNRFDFSRSKSSPSKSSNVTVEYEIAASRFYLQFDKLCMCSEDARPMHLLRSLCKESGLPIVPYAVTFKFYEQFEQTLPNVIQSFIIAIEVNYCYKFFKDGTSF